MPLIHVALVTCFGVVLLAPAEVNARIFSPGFLTFNLLARDDSDNRPNGGSRRLLPRRLFRRRSTDLEIVQGVVAVAVLQSLAAWIMGLMDATGKLVARAVEYLRIRALAGAAVLRLHTARYYDLCGPNSTLVPTPA